MLQLFYFHFEHFQLFAIVDICHKFCTNCFHILSKLSYLSHILFFRKAMLMLRKKKFQESVLDKTEKQLENIERMVSTCFL